MINSNNYCYREMANDKICSHYAHVALTLNTEHSTRYARGFKSFQHKSQVNRSR